MKRGGINQKRLQSGKYEEDDSDVDGECNDYPPLKQRKIVSHDEEIQRNSITRNVFNSRSVSDVECDSHLKNHNINVRISLSDEIMSPKNDPDVDTNDYHYDYNISENAESEDSNVNAVSYDYKSQQTLELNFEDATSTDESELDSDIDTPHVGHNTINHESIKFNRGKRAKQRKRRLRKKRQEFTNDQWRKKVLKQLKHASF